MRLVCTTGIAVVLLAGPNSAFAELKFPGDCDSARLQRAGSKNGCSVEAGGSHFTVKKGGQVVTQIPRTVKENGTCRAIIKALNEQCGG